MNVREKAQEVANLSASSCRGAEAHVRYMEQVSPSAPEIARAYLTECETHVLTLKKLAKAKDALEAIYAYADEGWAVNCARDALARIEQIRQEADGK